MTRSLLVGYVDHADMGFDWQEVIGGCLIEVLELPGSWHGLPAHALDHHRLSTLSPRVREAYNGEAGQATCLAAHDFPFVKVDRAGISLSRHRMQPESLVVFFPAFGEWMLARFCSRGYFFQGHDFEEFSFKGESIQKYGQKQASTGGKGKTGFA